MAVNRHRGESAAALPAVALAFRRAASFDRSAVSVRAGVIAALPVVGVLAAGTLAGDEVAAVTMGAGAMLVGIAWRAGGGLPPVATMATDAAVMGLSTFAGAASGRVGWLHLVLLAVWACVAGVTVAVGRRTAVVGSQAIIAFVVFGRFSQPIPAAAGLGALVLAGGALQVAFAALFGAPPALRIRRSACAAAYRRLAVLARDPGARGAEAAAALDEADRTLHAPSLLGDVATMPLTALVQEGRRMRLEFIALSLLTAQYEQRHRAADGALREAAERVQARAAEALRCLASVIEGGARPDGLAPPVETLTAAVEELSETVAAGIGHAGPEAALARRIEQHAAALAGQIRASAGLAAGLHEQRGRLAVRPRLGSGGRWRQLATDLDQVRANLSLRSPAGRHAVRLAVVVVASYVVAEHIPLQRGYWVVVSAATVLRPDFGGTLTRGAERMAGTCVGALLAGLVAVALHPSGWATVAVIGILAWAAYSLFPASFAAGIVFLTAMIVFLLEAVSPSTLATATDRAVDTVVGGALGLLAYTLWPTWSSMTLRQALADLACAHGDYLRAVLVAVAGGRLAEEEELRARARAARLAWTNAEAAIERSLSEPPARRLDIAQARDVMTGLRRLVQATHVLRVEFARREEQPPLPELEPLAAALDRALGLIAQTLGTGARTSKALPPLRALHRELATGSALDPVLETELDEIVDAVNTVGGRLGLRPGAEADVRPASRKW
ncbi:MAG TPA: FUSC family protein [Solirubrobacteraceae bacterium]|nr:FUSC family protein [Solirubrobacteraceae bacterium]